MTIFVVAGCSDAGSTAQDRASSKVLPIAYLHRDETTYDSVSALATSSSAVVTGSVVSSDSLGAPDLKEDPNASEFLRIGVKVDQVLSGVAPKDGVVYIPWDSYVTQGNGSERKIEVVQEGLKIPQVGEQLLLFLRPAPPSMIESFGGRVDSVVNTLDGILRIQQDSTLDTTIEGSNRLARTLIGKTVADVKTEISDPKN